MTGLNFDQETETMERKLTATSLPQQSQQSSSCPPVKEVIESVRKNDMIFEDFLNGLIYVSSSEE
jgi:hypothetical protein